MQSKVYFDLCTKKLAVLSTEVELRGSVNILDLHVHCEDFYARFLNLLFGLSLTNLNATQQNSAGIDLIDSTGKIVLQVSSTATFAKVQGALSHATLAGFKGYRFKFVSISKDADDLKKKIFANPHGLNFSAANDVIDIKSITGILLHLPPSKQQQVYTFLHEELHSGKSEPPSETNIAALIKVLSAEDLTPQAQSGSPIPFSIQDKLVFNDLTIAAELVDTYAVYQPRIDALYFSFDAAGKNRSTSVLAMFHSTYLKLKKKGGKDDDLFFSIIEDVMGIAKNSANHVALSEEELELCLHEVSNLQEAPKGGHQCCCLKTSTQ
jgi:hypothetical protein